MLLANILIGQSITVYVPAGFFLEIFLRGGRSIEHVYAPRAYSQCCGITLENHVCEPDKSLSRIETSVATRLLISAYSIGLITGNRPGDET